MAPNLGAYSGNPKFVNGLDFYFFAIPFVLADPGANREYLGLVLIDNQEYEAVKISYNDGVGASPDDYYIVHLDPETYQLKVLLYTATFNTQEPSENFYGRVYHDWKDVDGLLLPTRMVSHQWDAEKRQLGDPRGETTFTNIVLRTESPDASIFAPPEESEIAQ